MKTKKTQESKQIRINKHANQLHSMWVDYIKRAKGDCWTHHVERQILYDALTSMKVCGLIKGFTTNGVSFKEGDDD